MADGSSTVRAPGGWGHIPGAMLAGDVMTALPELPLLRHVASSRQLVLARAVVSVPGLIDLVRPTHLQRKYQIAKSTAREALRLARTYRHLEADRG